MIDFNWYNELYKPVLLPPAWLFAPVWFILYITILVSLIMFISKKTWQKKLAGYLCFFIQATLNILWMPAFFILKNIGSALLVIILLDIAVYFTIKSFYEVSKSASIILIPYFIWILFATYLNAAFFMLNN